MQYYIVLKIVKKNRARLNVLKRSYKWETIYKGKIKGTKENKITIEELEEQ